MLTRKELYNIPGWRTKRHFVVIESDDWGSIRMPSAEAYNEFLRLGIRVDNDAYCKYDSLATKKDLTDLFEVLSSIKDSKGRAAVITANAVVANPVFGNIKESGFRQYFYESFPETLKRDSRFDGAFEMWKEGIAEGLFHPQSHGREHLNVDKWMKALRNGHPSTIAALNLGTFGLTSQVDSSIKEYYMGAFNSGLDEDIAKYNVILTEALGLFERLFGYKSKSFIATTYEWNPKIEPCLIKNGVRYIQGTTCQKIPLDDDTTVKYSWKGFQGTKTKAGLTRLMRNCFFEPSTNPNHDYVDDCLNRIRIAFKWRKAAIICAHRVNFIGSIDSANTDRTLPEFKRLLTEIVKRWPDVEFVTSDELGDIMTEK